MMNLWTLFLLLGACTGGAFFGAVIMAMFSLSGRYSRMEEAREAQP